MSIGVSWNKIFAKLGSDMKKPDAVTVISPENYKDVVWTLPVEDLLYVGKATKRKLNKIGVFTIGELAQTPVDTLRRLLGKWGDYIHGFANGTDNSPVVTVNEEENVKSIGNSLTVYRDLKDNDDVETVVYMLADSVAARMRESSMEQARTVHIYVTSSGLCGYHKQGKLPRPTGNVTEIGALAFRLFKEIYPWQEYVRGVGVSVTDFYFGPQQLDMFDSLGKDDKQKKLDAAIDKIRRKYGNKIIQLASVYKDPKLKKLDIKGEHVIHPYSFFRH